MAENFARQAIREVRAELEEFRRKRGKKVAPPPADPVADFLKQRQQRIDSRRPTSEDLTG